MPTAHPLYHADVVPLPVPVAVASTQGTLALDLQPNLDPPEAPVGPARPDVDEWAFRYVQAAVEIVGGDRPVSQLVRHTSREVYADLERRATLVARAGGHVPGVSRIAPVRARVHSVHSCAPSPRVAEVSAHLRYGERSRAVAARFERRAGRWVCTALEFA
ncbi:Rv3235 family protein [Nocardioides sp. C4-1]|uniref:Rv3235 family protein n=1 Tax=Nocardioides sp. C4-1 TaxID=3151851 RepID=UPI0032640E2A